MTENLQIERLGLFTDNVKHTNESSGQLFFDFCSIVMFRLLFLMLMHIRLMCALIKITYLLTYLF